MANLNWGKGEQCQTILGNKGTKKRQQILGIKKLGKSLHTSLKGHCHAVFFWSNLGKDLNESFRSHVQHS